MPDPPIHPTLGDIELSLVQYAHVVDRNTLVRHDVPGRDTGVVHSMGRGATRLWLAGVMTGPGARDDLTTLREAFLAGEPLPFVADVARGLPATEVVLRDLQVRDVAGKPEVFAYRMLLVEYVEPPERGGAPGIDGDTPFDELVGAIDAMGEIPDFTDPTPPLLGMLDGLQGASSGLATMLGAVGDRTGTTEG